MQTATTPAGAASPELVLEGELSWYQVRDHLYLYQTGQGNKPLTLLIDDGLSSPDPGPDVHYGRVRITIERIG